MPSYSAQIKPYKTKVPNNHVREHCVVHRNQITTIGRDKGQQVRVETSAPDDAALLDFALYTVIDVHDKEPSVVLLGYEDLADLSGRLGRPNAKSFTGKINSQVTDNSDFTEHLTDNGRHRGLIVIAPHGGDIEKHTDEQAELLGKLLASKCVSVWVCKGFKKGGDAFDRWHITSTDISEASFPKLKEVMGRSFEYAIAFHGWDEDSVCIGGLAPSDLKQKLKTSIAAALSNLNPKVRVFTAEDKVCAEGFNGNDPRNIVNRLAVNGIQIEQSKEARERFAPEIAKAVARVIGPRIEVCTAPVFERSDFLTGFLEGVNDGVLALSDAEVPSIECEIKRLQFRLQNCTQGNSDPFIEL